MQRSYLLLCALSFVAILPVERTAQAQLASCCCYKIKSTDACEIPGVGVSCGGYSCPHEVMTSEPVDRCEQVAPKQRGRAECDVRDDVLASLCDMVLWSCVPPSGCVRTGVIHRVYYFNHQVIGPVCP